MYEEKVMNLPKWGFKINFGESPKNDSVGKLAQVALRKFLPQIMCWTKWPHHMGVL